MGNKRATTRVGISYDASESEAKVVPSKGEQTPWFAAEDYRDEAKVIADHITPLIEPLARMMGPRTEVLIHDLTRTPASVVAIAQSLSGRTVGSPPTNLGLAILSSAQSRESMVNYQTEMPGGVTCRSTTIFLNGSAPYPLVALCINSDVREVLQARSFLDSLLGNLSPESHESEVFYSDVSSLTNDLMRSSIESIGVPVEKMTRAQKIRVVAELKKGGFFIIREAADIAATALQVTRFTIYNYLNEIEDKSH